MEDAIQLLNRAMGIITFIIAMTLFLILNSQERQLLQSLKINFNTHSVMSEGKSQYELDTYGYNIIGELLSQPSYRIIIDGELMNIPHGSEMAFEEMSIDMEGTYERRLVINQEGNVIQVIYHKN